MRASRLLSLLMLLQTRGRMTAQALADELEVSVRTVYRDVDALGAAGVPVYGDRGPAGGYNLLDGYRTRLTGLTPDEAAALFLVGVPGAADALGLGSTLAAARLKLLAALPPEPRERAGWVQARFHLDTPGWFREGDRPTHLTAVGDAVWAQRPILVRYRRWGGVEVERTLEPLGLVLKGGAWYVVARTDGDVRTYRIARILELTILDDRFERPAGFDLAGYWGTWTGGIRERLRRDTATIRISPRALDLLSHLFDPAAVRAALAAAPPPDAAGWIRIDLPIESVAQAPVDLLRLGAEVEVLSPPALREEMGRTAAALAALYRDAAAGDARSG